MGSEDRGSAPTAAGRSARRRIATALHWLPALADAAVIFALSSDPDPEGGLPPGSILRVFYETVPAADKLTHFLSFLVFGFLVSFALHRTRPPGSLLRLRDNAVSASLVSMVYSATDEIHQHFVPNRTPDLLDFLADSAGAAAGALLLAFSVLRQWRRLAG